MRPSRLSHTSRHSFLPLCAVLALQLALSGCWGSSDSEVEPDLEPKELTTSTDALTTEVPEFELVRLSKKLYQVGMYSVARDSFSSLKDRYPLGAYATFAEVKLADTYYFNREFNEAAKSYESFLKNFPGHVNAPYVKLQAARSHVASSRGGGRDRQPLERGLALFDELIKEHPNTAYAALARTERMPVVEQLASYDSEIIEFYRKVGNTAAVQEREQKFHSRWGSQLQSEQRADPVDTTITQTHLASLGSVEALEPLKPTEKSSVETTSSTIAEPSQQLREGAIVVQSVTCRTEGIPFASIELTQVPPILRDTEMSPKEFQPEDDVIVVSGLDLSARIQRFNCFSSEDVEIRSNGDLAIHSTKPLTVSIVHNPPRILLSPSE
ncbi:MAG: outer membrane protein assembly factor BamD [Pseudomonadota bacterium]